MREQTLKYPSFGRVSPISVALSLVDKRTNEERTRVYLSDVRGIISIGRNCASEHEALSVIMQSLAILLQVLFSSFFSNSKYS